MRDARLVVGKPTRMGVQLSRREVMRANAKLVCKNEGMRETQETIRR